MAMMPMPPSHCSKARHSNTPALMRSSPISTVEPVVVRPDMDSKNASAADKPSPAKAKGRLAKTARVTQLSVVRIKVP